MTLTVMFSLALFTLFVAITPGPNNLLLAGSGAQFGIRKTVSHLIGIRLGLSVMLLVCASGFSSILTTSPILAATLKYLGLGYMLWLALAMLRHQKIGHTPSNSSPFSVTQAAVFQCVNIKSWTASMTVIASFSQSTHYWLSVACIITIFIIVGLFANLCWVWLGKKAAALLTTEKRTRTFYATLCVLTIMSMVPLVVT
ncbi:LysE family translocator [Pseudoalteromonas ruthenica]|uniref:LysE family translocator n=1 Tax=Pseudoalteromonas ruthenica TaxID=151081 RepID=UPI00034ADC8D|nr:LysE family translocator [Pseudoalteromonas ruthenica]